MRSQTQFTEFRGRKAAILAAALAAATMAATATRASPPTPAGITNPISAFPIEADGAYAPANEWSDIKPAWFISSAAGGAVPTTPGDPNANSLLFAGLAHDAPTTANPNPLPELYLMYDYLPRTAGPSAPNEFLGNVTFPINIHGTGGGVTTGSTNITVELRTISTFPTVPAGSSFFDVFVDLHDGNGFHVHPELGLEAGVGPGTTPVNPLWGITASSPFHTTLHELLELGVPLDIPQNFGTPGGPLDHSGGVGGGNGYSPAPAFWNSNLPKNPGDPDPPASAGLFTINPDGSTFIIPLPVPGPEPTTLGLVAIGGMMLGMRRRSRKTR